MGTNFVSNRPSSIEKKISMLASYLTILGIESDIFDFTNNNKKVDDTEHIFIKAYYRDGAGFVKFLNKNDEVAPNGVVSLSCVFSRMQQSKPIFSDSETFQDFSSGKITSNPHDMAFSDKYDSTGKIRVVFVSTSKEANNQMDIAMDSEVLNIPEKIKEQIQKVVLHLLSLDLTGELVVQVPFVYKDNPRGSYLISFNANGGRVKLVNREGIPVSTFISPKTFLTRVDLGLKVISF